MAMGRPTKYKDEYCEDLIKHMAQGYSFESFAGVIQVTIDCINKWAQSNPDFLYAKNTGRAMGLRFDEQMILGLITGKIKGNAACQIFKMKCRYRNLGWKDEDDILDGIDKIEVTVK